MNAIKLLKQQHREVEDLFKQIEEAEDSAKERRNLFLELATKFDQHARIEEKIFYPAAKEVDEVKTLEAYEEHDVTKAVIRKLKKTRSNDATFSAKIKVLQDLIDHHVEEEEDEVFPECQKAMGDERLEELGDKMEKMYERLSGKEKRQEDLAA